MRAIDTHAHLDFPQFDADRDELIAVLNQEKIAVISIATTPSSIEFNRQLASKHRGVFWTLGFHPKEVNEKTLIEVPAMLDEWSSYLSLKPRPVAVGEVGLDYSLTNQETTLHQANVLRQLITFAQDSDLPLIFHCREAYGDLLTILADYPNIQGVVHCFSGTKEQAEAFLKLGLHLSFTGMLTYPKNQELRQIAAAIPLDRLLLETDAPFLPPEGQRGERNTPLGVLAIAEQLAAVHDLPTEEVLKLTTATARRLFRITDELD